MELEIALTNLRDFLDPSHSDHRDPSRLIRVSSFAFGSSRSFAPHPSHSDHRDPSRLILRVRILRASSFAFGSSRSFAPHPSRSDHRDLHRCGSIRRPLRRRQLLLRPPSSWACPSFDSVSAGRTSREAVGTLPFFLSVCLSRDIYFRPSARASPLLWLHLPLRLHFLFDFTSSSTSLPLRLHLLFGFTSSSTVCPSIAAFVASLSPFGVWPLITGSQFGRRSRRDAEVRLRPSRAARPCWTLFLSFLFPSRRRWTGPSLAATDKSGGDDAGRGRGKAPGVVRSKASGR